MQLSLNSKICVAATALAILSLGTTEDSDELTLPALDARVTGAPIEVDAGKDEDVVMLEWTAQVSGSFSVTPA